MEKEQQMVKDFHLKYGCVVNDKPNIPDADYLLLRSSLITEELAEFQEGAREKNLVKMVDALADLTYVIKGAALGLGVDLEPVFEEVQRSNMSKTGDATPGGKITKGPTFVPPDIAGMLRKQGWQSN